MQQGDTQVINTDTKQRYLLALGDIDSCFLNCSNETQWHFMADSVWQKWRNWLHGTPAHGRPLEADYHSILRRLDEAVEAFPDDPWARAMRGRATVALGYYRAAMQDLEWSLDRVDYSAKLNIFYAEACFFHGKATLNDPLPHFLSAIFHLSMAIRFDPRDARPYFTRAQCDAHVMKLCGLFQYTDAFARRYRAIQDDLQRARKHSLESSYAMIDLIEQEINELLGIG
jgi:tetratricopeptide (TPR) repeat protein